ncbi:carboxynorspermidine decarboxylase [Moraxella bovoculi]|uniref:carboxynorspermidine decarboxylase n=1 Tax=Moraxella bovoculi TaxID=386891 RepID=UPI000624A574|nr:carboxynorspermidine decarboxylase [Moraxella bovoculi]AKG15266.1 carboxynorspermidine decarboxylase [Moraxella bovoculi]AKG16961.1 carboxynorspermidine decarboxylase [Moraxella bovoculi]AKG18705.1 carboxynorspermidine decarboxylase [Moraxella bovoculi]NSM10055.1 carboxynorspermidine decarboxylase [Moraxella bovoculi]
MNDTKLNINPPQISTQQALLLQGLTTPYYLLDEQKITQNLAIIDRLCQLSGAKALLALKCFATWGVFEAMRPYLHGTTSSSLFEVRLGAEKFGGETHAYSVAYSHGEIDEVLDHADKIIFNSISQLHAFKDKAIAKGVPVGLRLNPNTSNSAFILADPARPFSRLGEHDATKAMAVADDITGVMLHYNCENESFEAFSASLDDIEHKFGELFYHLDWVSLGGGIHFIAEDYPLEKLAQRLKDFAQKYNVQIYLEPGEACVHDGAVLVSSVLDVMENGKSLAVVDAATESHMLDLLIYGQSANLQSINGKDINLAPHTSDDSTIVYGKTCLAGDIFGEYRLAEPLKVGDQVAFGNAAAYTMVKKNWFNGVDMPSIIIKKLDGTIAIQRCFDYEDYKNSLS